MIRFVDLGKQLGPDDEWPREFAWYNTLSSQFLEFGGEMNWTDWKDFVEAFNSEPSVQELSRLHGLFPHDTWAVRRSPMSYMDKADFHHKEEPVFSLEDLRRMKEKLDNDKPQGRQMAAHGYIEDFDEMRETPISAIGYFGNREEDIKSFRKRLNEIKRQSADGSPDYGRGWLECASLLRAHFDKLFPVPPSSPPKTPPRVEDLTRAPGDGGNLWGTQEDTRDEPLHDFIKKVSEEIGRVVDADLAGMDPSEIVYEDEAEGDNKDDRVKAFSGCTTSTRKLYCETCGMAKDVHLCPSCRASKCQRCMPYHQKHVHILTHQTELNRTTEEAIAKSFDKPGTIQIVPPEGHHLPEKGALCVEYKGPPQENQSENDRSRH